MKYERGPSDGNCKNNGHDKRMMIIGFINHAWDNNANIIDTMTNDDNWLNQSSG